jgi:hypothetical protein
MAKNLTVRCKAFDGEGVRENRASVDRDGTVRVWDSVAGHYTTCHSLGRSALARIRRAATATVRVVDAVE